MSVFDAENIPPSGRMGAEPLKVGVLSKAAVKQQAVHKQQRCGAATDHAAVSRRQRPRAHVQKVRGAHCAEQGR
jgi:hypothetical protein